MRSGARTPPPDDLAAFYADQFDRVRSTLVLFTGDRHLGEELAQEDFVQTCQHWERVRTMEAPGAWCTGSASTWPSRRVGGARWSDGLVVACGPRERRWPRSMRPASWTRRCAPPSWG